ncbi:hypothetical protein [Filimonas effusa]|uniref:Uncharacterized protein n=1 Tax=Filimonas effusa TaxID=2508721 RepID=A0A4Q1D3Y7_9BACT|nr:hypothetical protein [Filimonas effusa]RXK83089.1 hypothetical protein ESB13_13270 [Filimonas effusa]
MTQSNQHLAALQDIKQMMEKSSRFISLSGLSGVAAGICAIIGAFIAHSWLQDPAFSESEEILYSSGTRPASVILQSRLFVLAAVVFIAALFLAIVFTWLRSKQTGIPLWGNTARKVMVAVAVPMAVGGIFILKIADAGAYGLIAPGCLFFYGLALLNASRYTLVEIRYLAYTQLILGALNLWRIGYGLHFWTLGFGISHIIYGIVMWYKYERN